MSDTNDNPSLAGAKFNIDRLIHLLLDALIALSQVPPPHYVIDNNRLS